MGSNLLLLAPLFFAGDPTLVGFQEARITALDGSASDHFAPASLDGDTLVVGARGDDLGAGSAYVFVRSGSAWVQQAKLTASDGAAPDGFGTSVALDGNTAVIGAPSATAPFFSSGAAYVFERTGTSWHQVVKLVLPDPSAQSFFGTATAIDGDEIAVGAHFDHDGSVCVFTRTGGAWTFEARLAPSDLADEDQFGLGLAIRGDRLLAGSRFDDDLGERSGSSYVFERTPQGWIERAKLLASDGDSFDEFGSAGALDDAHAFVGAPSKGVYVFEEGASGWTETAKILPRGDATIRFGSSVAVDGALLAVGAQFEGQLTPAIYVFRNDSGPWTEVARLAPADPVEANGIGAGVSIDAGRIASGAQFVNGGTGAVYMFRLVDSPTGLSYCFGDGSAGPCPCGNESDAELGRGGCNHSVGRGALLVGVNSASVAADDLTLIAASTPVHVVSLLGAGQQAPDSSTGFPFGGDGLRCLSGMVRRLGPRSTGDSGYAEWGPGLALDNGFAVGQTWNYQVWFRDPVGGPCGQAFNTTNAVEITWVP